MGRAPSPDGTRRPVSERADFPRGGVGRRWSSGAGGAGGEHGAWPTKSAEGTAAAGIGFEGEKPCVRTPEGGRSGRRVLTAHRTSSCHRPSILGPSGRRLWPSGGRRTSRRPTESRSQQTWEDRGDAAARRGVAARAPGGGDLLRDEGGAVCREVRGGLGAETVGGHGWVNKRPKPSLRGCESRGGRRGRRGARRLLEPGG